MFLKVVDLTEVSAAVRAHKGPHLRVQALVVDQSAHFRKRFAAIHVFAKQNLPALLPRMSQPKLLTRNNLVELRVLLNAQDLVALPCFDRF